MAHSKSAKKRIRQNETRRLRNRRRKSAVRENVRAFDEALSDGKTDQAAEELKGIYKKLDQVAAKGIVHKRAVARKKSQLAKRLAAQGD